MTKKNKKSYARNFLDAWIQAYGLTYEATAEIVGVKTPTVWRWAKGDRQLSPASAKKFCEGIGRPKEDWHLIFECGPEDSKTALSESPKNFLKAEKSFVAIPEYSISASAGYGAEVLDENIAQMWNIPKNWLSAFVPSVQSLVIITVSGDSMEPDYISGDKVIVDMMQNVFSHDGIYVLDFGFGLVIKQLQLIPATVPQKIRIISKNPSYKIDEPKLSDIRIIGRVVAKWAWK